MTRHMLDHNITILFTVPSMLAVLLEHMALEGRMALPRIRHVFSAGAALPPNTCRSFHGGAFPNAQLHNLYGPTESDMARGPGSSAGALCLAPH